MKKILTVLLFTVMIVCTAAFAACGTNNPEKLAPPEDVVEKDNLVFTYNKSVGTYSVKVKDAGAVTEKITIPGQINGYKVTIIEDYCFIRNEKLKEVVIEPGITQIGLSAFASCSALSSITLPETLISIKKGAFSQCTALNRIQIPDKVRSIEESAFDGCTALSEALLPETLMAISNNLFRSCALSSISLPGQIKKIGTNAFAGCNQLTEVRLNKNLGEIGANAFYNCTGLTEILFPRNDSLKIGDYAFANSGLTKVYIPQNVTLGTYTFMKLAWDDSIENPGDAGSKGASNCTAVYYESPTGSRGTNVFGYTWNRPDLGFRIYVPAGSLDYYRSDNPGDESWLRCVVNSVNSADETYSVLEEYDIAQVFPDGFPVAP